MSRIDVSTSGGFSFNFRAIFVGAIVDIGGSLVMTTIVGVTAITAMLVAGTSAQTIVDELPHSFALVLFCALGGMVMSIAGGYTAARIAAHAPLWHAFLAGLLAVLLNLGMIALIGDSGPIWLTTASTVLIVPCATIGGWLAMPVAAATAQLPSDLRN